MSVSRYARKAQPDSQDKCAAAQVQHDSHASDLARQQQQQQQAKVAPARDSAPSVPAFDRDAERIFTLPNGLTVTIGMPKGSCHLTLANIFRDKMTNYGMAMAKACLHIKAIDGESVYAPTNEVELAALMDRLGSDGVEMVLEQSLYFMTADLAVAKKNEPG